MLCPAYALSLQTNFGIGSYRTSWKFLKKLRYSWEDVDGDDDRLLPRVGHVAVNSKPKPKPK